MVALYEGTNGASWFNNTNWLEGEPCWNSWYGVDCCPDTQPFISDSGECTAQLDAVGNAPTLYSGLSSSRLLPFLPRDLEPRVDAVFPEGCHSGFVTGTPIDYARCVVVRIRLGANNLVGTLNGNVSALSALKILDLSENHFTGVIPSDLARLPYLHELRLAGA